MIEGTKKQQLREEWYDIDRFHKVRLEWKLVLPMVDYYCLLKFDSITTAKPTELEIQEMVNILVLGEAYDKVFNHLHAPLEGKPKSVSEPVVSNPKIDRDRVIIEDWNSDDEEESQEPKLKNVVNTGQREGKPVWDNTKRINHQNFSKYPHLSKTFVPSGVLTRTGLHRPSVSTARPVCTARPSVSTARPVCNASPSVSTARSVYAARPIYRRMDNVIPRGSCSPIKRSYYTKLTFRPKNLKQDVKTFGVQNMTTAGTRAVVNTGKDKLDIDLKKTRWVWRPKGNYLDRVSKDSRSFMLKKGNLDILLHDHAVVDSGCSSHMTGNKAYLSDYEYFNGGFVAFGSSSGKDKGPTQEYILLPLQPHRTRIPVEDVPPGAHEKTSESSPKDNDVQDSEDAANKESEQDLQDELEKMVTQELAAKAMDDVSRQAFEEEKRNIASQKRAAQATSTNKLSTVRSSVSTATTPYVCTASTPLCANAGESSFVYLGGKIPMHTSTLSNADLPIDPNMLDLEDASNAFSNDGIFNGAYDDENVGAVADFNNMDDTINVTPIPTLKIHKNIQKIKF
ncbi:hypothetical protein Tco_1149753 [Tanacetum coccineum]